MRFSSRQMASILGETQTKARRWVKEFLPTDPDKGLRSGKTRRHGLNDIFLVFVGGYLVCRMGFTVPEAKAILQDLGPWMGRCGLLPKTSSKQVPKDPRAEKVRTYDIHIMPTRTPLGFCYECRSLLREQKNTDGIVRSEYVIDHFFSDGVVPTDPAIDHARILSISNLLHRFKTMLSVNVPYTP
jgi:hypothetical protein